MLGARLPLSFAILVAACSSNNSGGDDDDDGAPLVCPDDTTSRGAIAFDGVDDYAKTAVDPAFGLATFTLEAWVRRDGDGTTYTTGVGGLGLVPIAGKGLGEGDGSNIDCNYGLGFWGDVLGADFEDMTSGGNHPVMGKTGITRGEWHHVAATYDGAVWRLYLDGALDGEATANAMPRADSIHAFAIGTAVASDGTTHGFLQGSIDELRLWNRARSAGEIADGMYRSIAMGEGLVARWSFDAGGADPTVAVDSVGSRAASLTGAMIVDGDVTLDHGKAPVVASASPADGTATGPDV